MYKNLLGVILGLLGVLLLYNSSIGITGLYRQIPLRGVLGILGILLIYLSAKLIDLKLFESPKWKNNKWVNYTISPNRVIIILLIFLTIAFCLILFITYMITTNI
ncbi:MAG: hypothetical protein HRU50_13225 [Winogradskyella sp.]|uniref:hypothetical protein n=1 Tax=Winogradskyella sp. TaxID=1883156 RepID=UPI0025D1127D|nr:hypothetical protein [Winogradskyella sp.]NRB60886.1 hypothetical protein [Winogradskyella sp.]